MPKSYPPEFRRKVLDLLDAGRKVADVAADLGVTQASIYIWRRQHLIDTGRMPGLTSSDHVEPSRPVSGSPNWKRSWP